MRRSNSTTPQHHHPPRTPSTLSRSITTVTRTTTSRTPTTTATSARPQSNASPRVSLPPPSSNSRRPASTLGLADAPKKPLSTLSSSSSSISATSPSRPTRPFTSLSSATSTDSVGTPRLALRTRDRNAALSSRPATPRFLKPLPPSTTTSTKALSTLSALSSVSVRSLSPMRPGAPPSTMGYDKDTPRKPTLASRPITRAPLTPKIAGTASTTPSSAGRPGTSHSSSSPYQTVTVSTPLARRVTGLSSTSGHSGNYSHNNYDSSNSPVPSYLNNVTPRSGSRQSRVDGGSTTPNGTPLSASSNGMLGLGISANSSGSTNVVTTADPDSKFFYASEAKSSSTSAIATSSIGAPSSSMGPPLASPGLAGPSSRPASTFFYANGKSLPSAAGSNSPSSASVASMPVHHPPAGLASPTLAGASVSTSDLSSKFVHANGAALERTPSSSSSTRRAPVTPTAQQQASRPLSPVKMATVAPYPLQKSMSFPVVPSTPSAGSSVNGSGAHRPSVPNNLSLSAAAAAAGPAVASSTSTQPLSGPVSPGSVRLDMLSRQRSNFSASVGSNSSAGGHSRKGSLTIADPPTVARLLHSSQPSSEVPSPASGQFPAYPFPSVTSNGPASPSANAAATSGLAAILQATEDLAGDDDAEGDDSVKSHADGEGDGSEHAGSGKDSRRSSTNVSAHPADQQQHSHSQVDELVTIARRERKVQDLEITNASLEAINRSLERQLRKQKAELRQFRRLSRSGRLSLAPLSVEGSAPGTAPGSRIASSSTVEGPIQDMDRLLGEDESFDFDDYDSDMENSFEEYDRDSNSDPDLDLDNENLTRRKREERRLQLDLAQHRQMLVDSQKINQSIKRCMNWTEALIQEGTKALAFQVRVSEVQLGGRVLAADEVEEREEQRRHSQHLEESERSAQLLEQTQALLDEHSELGGERSDPTERGEETVGTVKDTPATVSTSSSSVATPTSTASSSEEHDDLNEAFSPVSHNVRTVRFDDTGDTEIKPKLDSTLTPNASLNEVTSSIPEGASLTDAAPSTPSEQPLPPAAAAAANPPPIIPATTIQETAAVTTTT
ncbi:hypothetical protein SEUCBS139899_008020 [Sporothrix eucalyptigena]|uniref:Uncharacterized protein n=1 Tax=Sporothrix eucalyptigena TaxID=1812306 RepID=A0ABP0C209_9PEZI